MKLLHVFASFGPSPMATRLGEIAHAVRGLKHRVLSLDGDISATNALRAKLSAEPFIAGRERPDRLGLRQRLVDSGADILCTYGVGSLDAALANAAGPELPHIHHHDEAEEIDANGGARLRSLAAAGAVIVFSSSGDADRAAKRWRVPKARIRLIPPGVNTRRFRPTEGRAGDGQMVTVGFIGDLNGEREAQALVRAFVNMRVRSATQFAIYGEGTARPVAESRARTSGARGRIFFRGRAGDLPGTYDEFDIFFFGADRPPAERLLEAMASGLPVVGVAEGDAAAMVAGENLPLLAARGDIGALSLLLGRLVNDAALRETVGRANAAKARDAFSLSRMTDAYGDLYFRGAAG